MKLLELNQRRLFILTPDGLLLELVYRAAVTAPNERVLNDAH